MEKKLTADIAAKYFGCKIKTLHGDGVMDTIAKGEKDDIIGVRFEAVNFGDLKYKMIDADTCQLILKPLSKISDEDAIEVAKIAGQDRSDDTYKINMGKSLVTEYWRKQSNVDAYTWVDVIDFLRSRSYDIDNLINDGIAIEAK